MAAVVATPAILAQLGEKNPKKITCSHCKSVVLKPGVGTLAKIDDSHDLKDNKKFLPSKSTKKVLDEAQLAGEGKLCG